MSACGRVTRSRYRSSAQPPATNQGGAKFRMSAATLSGSWNSSASEARAPRVVRRSLTSFCDRFFFNGELCAVYVVEVWAFELAGARHACAFARLLGAADGGAALACGARQVRHAADRMEIELMLRQDLARRLPEPQRAEGEDQDRDVEEDAERNHQRAGHKTDGGAT